MFTRLDRVIVPFSPDLNRAMPVTQRSLADLRTIPLADCKRPLLHYQVEGHHPIRSSIAQASENGAQQIQVRL